MKHELTFTFATRPNAHHCCAYDCPHYGRAMKGKHPRCAQFSKDLWIHCPQGVIRCMQCLEMEYRLQGLHKENAPCSE